MTDKQRRTLLRVAGALAGTATFGTAFANDPYPTKPIRLLIAFPPGGGNDVVARIVAPRLSAALGQQVILENRPGATGTIATNLVAKSAPDGYTLLEGAVSTNVIANYLYEHLPYDPDKDIAPVTLLASIPQLIAVHPSLNFHSLKEMIAYAKANPGRLHFVSAGKGSTPHMAGEIFKLRTGTDLVHVPYKGAGESLPDLLSGRVPVSFDTTGTILKYIKGGQLRALAIAASKRFSGIPDVPTAAEAGVADYEISTWIGVFAPAGTPALIIGLLQQHIALVLRQPDVHGALVDQLGSDDTATPTQKDFADLIRNDGIKYAAAIKAAGIHLD